MAGSLLVSSELEFSILFSFVHVHIKESLVSLLGKFQVQKEPTPNPKTELSYITKEGTPIIMSGHYYKEKDEALLNSLYGTWTIVNEARTFKSYYKLVTYMVVHFMEDPTRKLGCFNDCSELENEICENSQSKRCIDIDTKNSGKESEWSDGMLT